MIDKSVKWPGGAKVAVMLTFDFDAETLWLSRDPANARRPGTLSQGTYGAKVGVPKILETLHDADLDGRATFFIPGWTVEDVANYLVEQKILSSADEFLGLCKSGEAYSGYYFIEEMMKTGTASQRKYALEGYLSPNTYEIYTSSSADTIIKRLLTQMEAAYLSGYDERAQELGMTMDEVVTLASMIEKEAKKGDFAKVSAVFHNRLKADMTLGSDVTIKYATGSQRMVLGDSELSVNSAYNTYTRKGLPVGPICNPSMDAIVAALYPDEQYVAQKYLYFCSTDPASGALHFSKTLDEHNAAVAMYRPLWEEYDKSRGLN